VLDGAAMGLRLRNQQFHLAPQRQVGAAGFDQERVPVTCAALGGCVEEPLDAVPALRSHVRRSIPGSLREGAPGRLGGEDEPHGLSQRSPSHCLRSPVMRKRKSSSF
jgi:hypothetical protein